MGKKSNNNLCWINCFRCVVFDWNFCFVCVFLVSFSISLKAGVIKKDADTGNIFIQHFFFKKKTFYFNNKSVSLIFFFLQKFSLEYLIQRNQKLKFIVMMMEIVKEMVQLYFYSEVFFFGFARIVFFFFFFLK